MAGNLFIVAEGEFTNSELMTCEDNSSNSYFLQIYRGIDLIDLERKVQDAFTEINTLPDDDDLDSSDIEGIVQHSKHRISTDITDILWDVLKCEYQFYDFQFS